MCSRVEFAFNNESDVTWPPPLLVPSQGSQVKLVEAVPPPGQKEVLFKAAA